MGPAGGAGGGAGPPATYVTSLSHISPSGTDSFSVSGVAVGEILVMHAVSNSGGEMAATTSNGTTPTAMTKLGLDDPWPHGATNYASALFYRVLTSSDVNAGSTTIGITNSNADFPAEVAVYSGATSVTKAQFVSSNTTDATLPFAAVTPAGDSKGFVALIVDRANSSTTAIAPPATLWTTRLLGDTSGAFFARHIADSLSGATGGAATWTGFDTTLVQSGYWAELH
jgi:hypothetical protein